MKLVKMSGFLSWIFYIPISRIEYVTGRKRKSKDYALLISAFVLVIFDLDQTLVDFISVYDVAMDGLFQKFFGVSARLTEIDFAGRSLTDSFTKLARLKGIAGSEVSRNSRGLLEEFERLFVRSIPQDSSQFVLPGARELLEALAKTDNVVVLYTGSAAGIVATVLAATNLGKYFKFCLYGTEFKTRADMVGEALDRAERLAGKRFRSKDIVIIGDSLRDVDCGKQFGALTIAVATGLHSADQLSNSQPDSLFASLKDFNRVLKAIS